MNNGEVSTNLKEIEQEIKMYQRQVRESIIEIGKRLKHVKENDLVHGEWGKWLDGIGINRRSANRYIKAYDVFGNKPEVILNVSSSKIFEFISFDDPLSALKFKNKTVKEIRKIKRQISSKENKKKVKESISRERGINCKCCNIDCTPIVEWHHILPISRGGENTEDNVIPLCPNCHAVVHRLLSSMNEGVDLENWLKTKYSLESREMVYKLVNSILDSEIANNDDIMIN